MGLGVLLACSPTDRTGLAVDDVADATEDGRGSESLPDSDGGSFSGAGTGGRALDAGEAQDATALDADTLDDAPLDASIGADGAGAAGAIHADASTDSGLPHDASIGTPALDAGIIDSALDSGPDTPSDGAAAMACGNGVLDEGEACDDGNRVLGDGCSAACVAERAECTTELVRDFGGAVTHVAAEAQRLYVLRDISQNQTAIEVFDIADPAAPVEVGRIYIARVGFGTRVTPYGSALYVYDGQTTRVTNVTDPTALVIEGEVPFVPQVAFWQLPARAPRRHVRRARPYRSVATPERRGARSRHRDISAHFRIGHALVGRNVIELSDPRLPCSSTSCPRA